MEEVAAAFSDIHLLANFSQAFKFSFVGLTQYKPLHPISPESNMDDSSLSMDDLPGQYEYDNFAQVLEWVGRLPFNEFSLAQHRGHLKLREYYLRIGNPVGVRSIEKIIKSDVGIRRLAEDIPGFREKFRGKKAQFHDGKFVGWRRGAETHDPAFAGIVSFTIKGARNEDSD